MSCEGWKNVTLNDVCIKITDGSHVSPASENNGYYMASVKDMKEYGFDFCNCRRISANDYEKLCANGCQPEYGDVLIGKDGVNYFVNCNSKLNTFIIHNDSQLAYTLSKKLSKSSSGV